MDEPEDSSPVPTSAPSTESTRHTYLAPAPMCEPAAWIECTPQSGGCGSRVPIGHARHRSGADRRRRPFPRSVGGHARNDARSDAANYFADATVSVDAHRGAEHAMRLLLEVLDRRRPAEKLGTMFAAGVIESVRTIVRTSPPGSRLGPATLRRLHVTRATSRSAEVFGTYQRGSRVFAIAARLDYRSGRKGHGWTVTSLRVG